MVGIKYIAHFFRAAVNDRYLLYLSGRYRYYFNVRHRAIGYCSVLLYRNTYVFPPILGIYMCQDLCLPTSYSIKYIHKPLGMSLYHHLKYHRASLVNSNQRVWVTGWYTGRHLVGITSTNLKSVIGY